VTNPYGTDPGSEPHGLGDPGNQGPQFVAPGTPGVPGQYGPPQYGPPQYVPPQGPPPQPYGQPGPYGPPGTYPPPRPTYATQRPYQPGYQQAFGQGYQGPYGPGPQPPVAPQAPRKRSASTAIVIVVLLALVAGITVGAYQLYLGTLAKPVTQSTPSRPAATTVVAPSSPGRPTPSTGSTAGSADCISGDKITTSDFVATVPANWSCDGDDGDISISSTRNDALWVEHDAGTGDLAADCKAQIQDLGTVSSLSQEPWGGKRAVAYQAVDSDDIFGVRCVVVGAQTWYLMYFPLDAKDELTVRADVTKVLSTWVWK
jgi:hypothetical protein